MTSINLPYEEVGTFWLPVNQSKVCDGKLSIDNRGHVSLELRGGFSDLCSMNSSNTQSIAKVPRILGQLADCRLVTLEHCDVYRGSIGRIGTDHVVPTWAHFGLHYRSDEPINTTVVVFSVKFGETWIKGLEDNLNILRSVDERRILIEHKMPADFTVALGDQSNLTIKFEQETEVGEINPLQTVTTTRVVFKIESAVETPVEKIIEKALYLMRFLAVAMDMPVALSSMKYKPDLNASKLASRSLKDGAHCQVCFAPKDYPCNDDTTIPSATRFLFTFSDVESRLERILAKWIERREDFQIPVALYLTTIYDQTLPLPIRFLLVTQALESLHRNFYDSIPVPDSAWNRIKDIILDTMSNDDEVKYYKEEVKKRLTHFNSQSFRQRLRLLATPHSDLLLLEDKKDFDSFVGSVIDSRNGLTHNDHKQKKPAEGLELLALHSKCEVLVSLTLLRLLDFDPTQISSLVKRNCVINQKLRFGRQNRISGSTSSSSTMTNSRSTPS